MLLAVVSSLLLSALQVGSTAPAVPLSSQAGPPPPPAFDVDAFAFLVGRWRGAGAFFNGKPVASEMSFRLANRTTMEVQATEDPPNTYRYIALWSREKESNDLLMLLSSSLDGPALYKSAGWQGDRLVFEPKAGVNTGPSRVRFTYVRTGPQGMDITYEFSIGDKWLVGDRQSFTKVQ